MDAHGTAVHRAAEACRGQGGAIDPGANERREALAVLGVPLMADAGHLEAERVRHPVHEPGHGIAREREITLTHDEQRSGSDRPGIARKCAASDLRLHGGERRARRLRRRRKKRCARFVVGESEGGRDDPCAPGPRVEPGEGAIEPLQRPAYAPHRHARNHQRADSLRRLRSEVQADKAAE